LHTTQPGLSKWLKELEADIGLPLFERHARGVHPTPYGQALIAHARRIEAHLDTARDDLFRMRDEGNGLVTIGFAGASSLDTVPMAVLKIVQELPNAHVRLLENKIASLMADLSEGVLDIVVGHSDMESQDTSICSEVLYLEPIHLVVRVNHPLLAIEHPTWADVLQYPWALWAKDTPVRTAFDKALSNAGQTPPAHYIESNSASLTTTLLIHSDMVGVASQRPALRYSQMNILAIVPIELSEFGSVTMYWRQDVLDRQAVQISLRAVRQVVKEFSSLP